jgi:hypothetical protein
MVEHRALPPLENRVEMKDSPELFARTLYAKTVSMLEARTNEVQMHPRYGPSVREQWIRSRGDAGGFDSGQAQGFSISSLPFLCDNFLPAHSGGVWRGR